MQDIRDVVLHLVGPAAALAGVCFAIRHFKISRTVSYMERFNSPQIVPIRAKVNEWLLQDISEQEKLQQAATDQDLSMSVSFIGNLFQELGVAYHYRLIHRQVAWDLFDWLTIHYWENLEFWIMARRTGCADSGTIYRRFEQLYLLFKKRREESKERLAHFAENLP